MEFKGNLVEMFDLQELLHFLGSIREIMYNVVTIGG